VDVSAAAEVLRSGWLSAGPRVAACERTLAETFGRAEAVLTGSPASALHLALVVAGVGAGHEVVVSALSSATVAVAVRDAGARRVVADVDAPQTLAARPDEVAQLIGPATGAVVASHTAGYACDLEPLADLCAAGGVPLVEDVSEAPLAVDAAGHRAGSRGVVSALSFSPDGPIPTPPVGALLCDDRELAERARRLRSHGMTSPTWSRHTGTTTTYDVVELGYSYRPDEVRAALVSSLLPELPAIIERRRALTRAYRARLAAIRGVAAPYTDADVEWAACFRMVALLDSQSQRDRVRDRMARQGVEIAAPVVAPDGAPAANDVCRRALVLPLFSRMDEHDVDAVATALSRAVAT
jgi:dTDP-4-amino-4,6-dideoxygalactose transaminase